MEGSVQLNESCNIFPALLSLFVFFLMIRRPPRSTPLYSSAASDVYKRQRWVCWRSRPGARVRRRPRATAAPPPTRDLSLIHISEPTRQAEISYAVFCL